MAGAEDPVEQGHNQQQADSDRDDRVCQGQPESGSGNQKAGCCSDQVQQQSSAPFVLQAQRTGQVIKIIKILEQAFHRFA
jgi:hypothetical protein